MLKRATPGAGLWIPPHRPCHQPELAPFNPAVAAFLAEVERSAQHPGVAAGRVDAGIGRLELYVPRNAARAVSAARVVPIVVTCMVTSRRVCLAISRWNSARSSRARRPSSDLVASEV